MKFPLMVFTSLTGAIIAEQSTPATSPCHTADYCSHTYCVGPARALANAPFVNSISNMGWRVMVQGLYWKPHMDGLEYAIDNGTGLDDISDITLPLNQLVDAKWLSPDFHWDFGFKIGLGSDVTCDGWNLGLDWLHFRGGASSHDQTADEPFSPLIMPIWSALATIFGSPMFISDIKTHWKLNLDLVDLKLGRHFWTGPRFSLKPKIGLRYARLDQDYDMQMRSSLFRIAVNDENSGFNEFVQLDQIFYGGGLLAGLDAKWHFGCGFSFYGNLATSIIYGKFFVDHEEFRKQAQPPFNKASVLKTQDHFRASRAGLDLGIGVLWSRMLCACQYGLSVSLGWEKYLFFHQNQLFRLHRNGNEPLQAGVLPNNSGENVFSQSRGTASVGGWTLSARFDF